MTTHLRHDPPPYRKVWRSIVASDKLATVSFEARWLYVLLLVEQDDDGDYLWTPVFRRKVIVGTPWTDEQATAYADELTTAGLCEHHGNCIRIVGGPEKNGQLRNYNTRFVYPGKSEKASSDLRKSASSKPEPSAGIPAWAQEIIDTFTPDCLTPKNIEHIEGKYTALDLYEEATKFSDYWTRRGAPEKFSVYRRLLTWPGKALEEHQARPAPRIAPANGAVFYPEQIPYLGSRA